jgi:hypothetical protein
MLITLIPRLVALFRKTQRLSTATMIRRAMDFRALTVAAIGSLFLTSVGRG